jgi:excisionase family DNA binding protein
MAQSRDRPFPPDLLTVAQAASLLHLHPNTIRRWANQGLLRALRLGPRQDRRFYRRDIERLLNGDSNGVLSLRQEAPPAETPVPAK